MRVSRNPLSSWVLEDGFEGPVAKSFGQDDAAPERGKKAGKPLEFDRFFEGSDVPEYLRTAGRTPEEAAAFHRRMENLLQTVARDNALTLIPGDWWAYDPVKNFCTYPIVEMMSRPDDQVASLMMHEVAHFIFTEYITYFRNGEVPDDLKTEAWMGRSFLRLNNVIEDVRINMFQLRRWAGLRKGMANLYRAEWSSESREVRKAQWAKKLESMGIDPEAYFDGETPKSSQLMNGILYEWADKEFFGGQDGCLEIDDDVKASLEKLAPALRGAFQLHIDPERDIFALHLQHGQVQRKIEVLARESYYVLCRDIWPEFVKFLKEDVRQLQELQQGAGGSDGAGGSGSGGSAKGTNSSEEAARDAARKALGDLHEEDTDKHLDGHEKSKGNASNGATKPVTTKDPDEAKGKENSGSDNASGSSPASKARVLRDLNDRRDIYSSDALRLTLQQQQDQLHQRGCTDFEKFRRQNQPAIRSAGGALAQLFEKDKRKVINPTLTRRGTRLNVAAYSRNLAAAKAGQHPSGSQKIFNKQSKPTLAHVVVGLVIDNSASMAPCLSAVQQTLVVQMESLGMAKVPTFVVSFGDSANVIKQATQGERYDRKLSQEVLSGVNATEDSTNDVAGVFEAIGELARFQASESIVFVITDGEGNKMPPNIQEMARSLNISLSGTSNVTTVRALCDYAKQNYNTIIYGIALGRDLPMVEKSYPNYIVIETQQDLPRVIQKVVRRDIEGMRARRSI